MNSYVIGDVHGCNRLLRKLIAKIPFREQDTIVFVGDYIDRGLDSKGVIDTLLTLKKEHERTVFLKGNHEQWMLQSHLDDTKNSWILGMNGLTAIESYSQKLAQHFKEILKKAGTRVLTEKINFLPYDDFFLRTMPATHLSFFHDLKLYHEDEHIICTHAGLDVDAALSVQQEVDVLWGSPQQMIYEWKGQKTLVMGHENTHVIDPNMWGKPIFHEKVVLLDTAPSVTDTLTCVRFPDRTIFQAKS